MNIRQVRHKHSYKRDYLHLVDDVVIGVTTCPSGHGACLAQAGVTAVEYVAEETIDTAFNNNANIREFYHTHQYTYYKITTATTNMCCLSAKTSCPAGHSNCKCLAYTCANALTANQSLQTSTSNVQDTKNIRQRRHRHLLKNAGISEGNHKEFTRAPYHHVCGSYHHQCAGWEPVYPVYDKLESIDRYSEYNE